MGVYQFLQSMKGVPVIGELGQGIRHGSINRTLNKMANDTALDAEKKTSAILEYLDKKGISPVWGDSHRTDILILPPAYIKDLANKDKSFDTFINLIKTEDDANKVLKLAKDSSVYKFGRHVGQHPEAYAIGAPLAYLGGRAIFSGDDNANSYSNNYSQYVQGVPQAQPIVTNTPVMMNGVPVTQQTTNEPVYITNPNTGQVIPTNIPLPVLNDEEITRQKEYLQKKIATDLVTYRALEQMRVPPNNTQGI